MPPAAVFRSRRAVQINSRLPGKDVPVRVRQGVVAIQAGQASVANAVVQVAKGKPKQTEHPRTRTARPKKGALPLWAAYAAHSPRFPVGESRARMAQSAYDRAETPSKQDKPAAPTPLAKKPKASHSLVPITFAFS